VLVALALLVLFFLPEQPVAPTRTPE